MYPACTEKSILKFLSFEITLLSYSFLKFFQGILLLFSLNFFEEKVTRGMFLLLTKDINESVFFDCPKSLLTKTNLISALSSLSSIAFMVSLKRP